MSDFLRDPAHPDRPQHPDFWRLSNVVLQLDANTESEQDYERVLGALVDQYSVDYMGMQRALMLLREIGMAPNPTILSALTAMFSTGVATGIRFQQEGGRRTE